MPNHYSLKQVAEVCGVKAHRISYAISNGFIAEPIERITNRRLFTEADLRSAKLYFATKSKLGRPANKEPKKDE